MIRSRGGHGPVPGKTACCLLSSHWEGWDVSMPQVGGYGHIPGRTRSDAIIPAPSQTHIVTGLSPRVADNRRLKNKQTENTCQSRHAPDLISEHCSKKVGGQGVGLLTHFSFRFGCFVAFFRYLHRTRQFLSQKTQPPSSFSNLAIIEH